MQYVSGTAAQDYNRRTGREGAFWSDRYHATLVQDGRHLARCFYYVEMNMVRAGVVGHPSEWYGGAWREHIGDRKRYRIVDTDAVCRYLQCESVASFRAWYEATVAELCARASMPREPLWTEAAAVGARQWIEAISDGMPSAWTRMRNVSGDHDEETWAMSVGRKLQHALLGMLQRRRPPCDEAA